MTDFVTIAESKKKYLDGVTKNASFIATVIQSGDLKSGTKNNNDWSNKKFTIRDSTETLEITAWGDEIKLLEIGGKYEFNTPYWSDYQGKPQLAMGQYCKVVLLEKSSTQTTMEQPAVGKSTPEPTKEASNSPLSPDMITTVSNEARTLFYIRQQVEATVKAIQVDPNQGMIWQMTEIIHHKFFDAGFKRASDL